jgi:hypothetical protein
VTFHRRLLSRHRLISGRRLGASTVGAAGAGICVALVLAFVTNAPAASRTAEEHAQIGKSLATMLRSVRTVISKNQDRINDPNIGNKGLDGKVVLAEASTLYQQGAVKLVVAAAAAGVAGYVAFMCTVDVPMYFVRWQADLAAGRQFFGLFSGLHDVATRWVVTHDATRWDGEITWMSLYFSTAVWTSLLLASFGLVKHLMPHYRAGRSVRRPAVRPLAVPVRYRR